MSNESILEMFYNDILPSIAAGNLKVEDAVYNIHFNTAIYDNNNVRYIANIHNLELQTLEIKDVKLFSHLLLQYINEVMTNNMQWCQPYMDVATYEGKVKYYLSLLWSNMAVSDFADPMTYIERYISFVNDNTFKDLKITYGPIEKLDNFYLEISSIEEKACYETPYAFHMTITDPETGNRFALPDVKYGIENLGATKKAYIYAVQYDSKKKEESPEEKKFRMKINRLLYKVDQDISKEELGKKMETQTTNSGSEENIVDVTPSSLVSLTAALSLLAHEGITTIIIPDYLPLRWESKGIMYERKINYYKNRGYSEEQLEIMAKDFNEEQMRIGRNVTDKLLRNFRRLEYHFDGININAYPFDVDSFMHLTVNPNLQAYNSEHLLGEISSSISNYDIDQKRK